MQNNFFYFLKDADLRVNHFSRQDLKNNMWCNIVCGAEQLHCTEGI